MSVHDELATLYAAFEKGDPDRLAELYTDGAVFLRNGIATVVGREKIRDLFGASLPIASGPPLRPVRFTKTVTSLWTLGPFFVAECGYPGSWAYIDVNPMEV